MAQDSAPKGLEIAVHRTLTQDFSITNPLAGYSRFHPVIGNDGSFHLYCLSGPSGTGKAVHLSRQGGNDMSWTQAVIDDVPLRDLRIINSQGGQRSILLLPAQMPPAHSNHEVKIGYAYGLNDDGRPGPSKGAWPRGWVPPIYLKNPGWNLNDVMAPSLGMNTNLMYDQNIVWAMIDDIGYFDNGFKRAALEHSENSMILLPSRPNEMNFIYRSNGQLAQWNGNPAPDGGATCVRNLPGIPAIMGGLGRFAVSCRPTTTMAQGGTITVVATGATGGLFTIKGTYDDTLPGDVQWAPFWTFIRPLDAQGNAARYDNLSMIDVGDGTTTLLLHDEALQLHIMQESQSPGTSWGLPLTIETGVTDFVSFLDGQGLPSYVCATNNGLFLATRAVSGEWVRQPISPKIEEVAKPTPSSVYRCGIVLVDDAKAGVPKANVTIEASSTVASTVQGHRYVLGPGRVIETQTDGTGAVWVAVELDQSGIGAPALTFRSPSISGGQVVVMPDADVQNHLLNVTAQDLASGTDGNDTPVLKDDVKKDADEIAQALHKIAKLANTSYERESAQIEGVKLRAMRGVSLEALTPPGAFQHKPLQADESWVLSMRTGRPVFRLLGKEEVETLARRVTLSSPAELRSFLGIDWGDLWDSVVDGFTNILEIAVHAAEQAVKATITFIVNGIEMVVTTALDGLKQVFDLVTGVFAQVATVIGTVTGWLMKEIGYLFGWKKILDRRNAVKTLLSSTGGTLVQKYPYPANGLPSGVKSFLGDIENAFGTLRSHVDGSPENSTFRSSDFPTPTDVLGTVLSPVSWIMEKVQALTGTFGALPALPSSLTTPMQTFSSSVSHDVLAAVMSACTGGPLGNWMKAASSLVDGRPGDLLVPIEGVAQELGSMLVGAVEGFDQLARSVWTKQAMDDLFGFFDSTVDIPFLSGFYKGLTEHDLSMLDLLSLILAIIDDAAGVEEEVSLRTLAKGLYWTGVITRLISSAAFSFNLGKGNTASFLDMIDTAVCVATSIVTMLASANTMDPWFAQSVFYLMCSTLSLLGKGLDILDHMGLGILFSMLSGIVGLVGGIYMTVVHDEKTSITATWLDAVALILGAVAATVVKEGTAMPGAPASAIVYTAIQTFLAAGCATCYQLSPENYETACFTAEECDNGHLAERHPTTSKADDATCATSLTKSARAR